MPKYVSDLDIYVWQRYRRSPTSQKAYLVRPFTADQKTQRLIVRLNSTAQIANFKEQRCEILSHNSSICTEKQWSTVDEIILSILAVCNVIVGDTTKFLEGVNEQLDYLVSLLSTTSSRKNFKLTYPQFFEGRSNPSPSKIEYLLHLDDCGKEGLKGAQQALATLTNLSLSFKEAQLNYPTWGVTTELSLCMKEIIADLKYLTNELVSTGLRIDELRKSVGVMHNPGPLLIRGLGNKL